MEMVIYQAPGATVEADASTGTSPLVVLYERDDAVAVPLLSQLRLANYDVRAARTPVELFDILSKHVTSLVLVDLGNATAGRREFWVALDAHRRGRNIQVMTFRFLPQGGFIDADFEPAGRALADVEVHGAQEFQHIIDGVRQRLPVQGGGGGFGPYPYASPPASSYPGGIAPIGAVLGVPSPFMYGSAPAHYAGPAFGPPQISAAGRHYDPTGFGGPGDQPFGQPFTPYGGAPPGYQPGPPLTSNPYSPLPADSDVFPFSQQPGFMTPSGGQTPSPFSQPFDANPYMPSAEQSPFAQPYSANPFADVAAEANPLAPAPTSGFVSGPAQFTQPAPTGSPTPPGSGTVGASPGPSAYDPWHQANAQAAAMPGSGPFATDAFAPGPARYAIPGSGSFAESPAGMSSSSSDALRKPASGPVQMPEFSDVWIPPDGGLDGDTGVVPEMAFRPVSALPDETAPYARPAGPAGDSASYSRWPEPPASNPLEPNRPAVPAVGDDSGPDTLSTQQLTSPMATPNRLLVVRDENPAERALGNVLVEGSLLTPNRLEVLKGIQQMLASVDMSFKLGELALLFKFLSPDQLLAALLVSRGLVSPQQIAGLGRVKQELAGSGMDYDLETLLGMFHILPPEQLHQLRAELA